MDNNKLYISDDYHVKILDTTFQKFINHYMFKNLSNLKTTELILKKKLKFKAKVPIYIDKYNLLLCVKSYRSDKAFYINFKAIYDYKFKHNSVYITFINHHTLRIDDKFTFLNQLEKCQRIIKYLNT